MSNQLDKDGFPEIMESDNQLDSNGMPQDSAPIEELQEDMEKYC